jgi:hypothetical protein
MIITIKGKDGERQTPTVTIDTKTCHYPYSIREAIQLALKLDGYDESTIMEVFNKIPETSVKFNTGGTDSISFKGTTSY